MRADEGGGEGGQVLEQEYAGPTPLQVHLARQALPKMRERARERVCVCVCVRERERERAVANPNPCN